MNGDLLFPYCKVFSIHCDTFLHNTRTPPTSHLVCVTVLILHTTLSWNTSSLLWGLLLNAAPTGDHVVTFLRAEVHACARCFMKQFRRLHANILNVLVGVRPSSLTSLGSNVGWLRILPWTGRNHARLVPQILGLDSKKQTKSAYIIHSSYDVPLSTTTTVAF